MITIDQGQTTNILMVAVGAVGVLFGYNSTSLGWIAIAFVFGFAGLVGLIPNGPAFLLNPRADVYLQDPKAVAYLTKLLILVGTFGVAGLMGLLLRIVAAGGAANGRFSGTLRPSRDGCQGSWKSTSGGRGKAPGHGAQKSQGYRGSAPGRGTRSRT